MIHAAAPANPLIIGAIILAFGLYTTFTGFGIVERHWGDAKKSSQWRARSGQKAQLGGPLLVLLGLGWVGYHLFIAK